MRPRDLARLVPRWIGLPSAKFRIVTPGYFPSLRIPVTAGRDFEEGDMARQTIVVNRGVSTLVLTVALLALVVPALRASLVDPLAATRAE
jgi:hypothetical protein